MESTRNSAARIVTLAIFLANLILLAISIPDYRVPVDAGYHVSLAEWYAHHGVAWWDHINFGPGGRPNLQGPALHIAIAILGSILGGKPDNFVIANAILGVFQWCAAVNTAYFFARRFGGDIAAMFAVALLAGSAFVSGSFYVGIPSGWLFIAAPWAIHFFLEDRLALATAITSLACYTHLGGYLTVPLGIAIAAAIERRWRSLVIVGIATAILTAPYTIHFIRNLGWYRGKHGHEALRADLLLDGLGLAGFVWILLRRPRNTFLIAWALAPISWVAQDYSRFIMQGALAGSVFAGLLLAYLAEKFESRRARVAFATAIVTIATIWPLDVPNILAEASWDAGLHFPRMLEWNEARALASVIDQNHLNDRLLQVYETSFAPAIAVYTPVVLQRGHWVEVQPLHDPATELSAGIKAYVLPLAPDDPFLIQMRDRGFVHVWGGTIDSSVVTLGSPADEKTAQEIYSKTLIENCRWLSKNAINNKMPNSDEMRAMLTHAGMAAHRARLDEQRFHAARMDVVTLIYAYSMEKDEPQAAHRLRDVASGFGSMASFLSDGNAVGFTSDVQIADLRKHAAELADAMDQPDSPTNRAQVGEAFDRLFHNFFGNAA
ncbi:MAG TPA: hypothetical protein VEF03_07630 [Candidatus Binataceae bacterium]|nr:hypothetical protein [Candidatus Binataceae bacterium]